MIGPGIRLYRSQGRTRHKTGPITRLDTSLDQTLHWTGPHIRWKQNCTGHKTGLATELDWSYDWSRHKPSGSSAPTSTAIKVQQDERGSQQGTCCTHSHTPPFCRLHLMADTVSQVTKTKATSKARPKTGTHFTRSFSIFPQQPLYCRRKSSVNLFGSIKTQTSNHKTLFVQILFKKEERNEQK